MDNKKLVFLKQLSTFVEDRMRVGIVKSEIKFPIDSALTFHYICCL